MILTRIRTGSHHLLHSPSTRQVHEKENVMSKSPLLSSLLLAELLEVIVVDAEDVVADSLAVMKVPFWILESQTSASSCGWECTN